MHVKEYWFLEPNQIFQKLAKATISSFLFLS